MNKIINTTDIKTVSFINGRSGSYRAIVKVQAGFLKVVEDSNLFTNWHCPMDVFRSFEKKALQTIEFKAEGSDNWLVVFAKSGNKIKFMDVQMFEDIKVADINQHWTDTNLYDQKQYAMVNAKNWDCKAFVMNAA